ncbi:ATP synthase F1 subunit gamma [Blattabacterium sp. (Blaberus giganteus)]|uniref:ATP synthase F1 subunit gamma n=1 Tax=Blattabacterium sp. (Blaberus giganteus) TaxID=1186051 RepID=UPI00025F6E46|nr:ATP synthase F1 subunit gamma [Blattabacterium sp. (Blaberus giganteus)]AFJ90533.1 ATP synthase F1 subunit gamma [Blattabacterium sp. (Blaberus giganteus)]
MSNPKEIKRRISSIESVIKTTEAMKMISIAKLRKTKDLLIQVKIYFNYIESILLDLLSTEKYKENSESNKYFLGKGKIKLFVVFTSDRGLCGSFNSSIFEKINHILKKKKYSYNECVFLSIGKKGFDFLYKKYNMYSNKNWIVNNLSNQKIEFLVSKLIFDFFQKKFYAIYLIYNHLKQSLFQEIVMEKFLPISNWKKKTSDYILEPSRKEILNFLIPKFLNAKLLKVFLESTTAEHTSRMRSMHKATENAYDIKHDLILNYNKERQTTITKEILEIISGLESLKK